MATVVKSPDKYYPPAETLSKIVVLMNAERSDAFSVAISAQNEKYESYGATLLSVTPKTFQFTIYINNT